MEVSARYAVAMTDPSRAGEARRVATTLARGVGLDETQAATVALVVTEAANNLLRHARDGQLLLGTSTAEGTDLFCVVAVDRGPGIADVAAALRDGFSTHGTPGTGLGAIRRLSTLFEVHSSRTGTVVVAGIARRAPPPRPGALECAGVCVPHPGETECGDAWAVRRIGLRHLLLVVDGLGHGAQAAEAARAAVGAFSHTPSDDPAEVLAALHAALRPTRGAAAAVAALDAERRLVLFAGIGNVAGTILDGEASRSMVSHHGILGHQVRRFQDFTYPWPQGATLIMHSDGLQSRWTPDAYRTLAGNHPMVTAGLLYRDYQRGRDDTTVLVAREAA